MSKLEVLKGIEIGERVAEEEVDSLERYFVETNQWKQMREGQIDVVYGPKGSGKSAIYTILNRKEGELFDAGILIASAENVRGATVFSSIVADPPPSEISFVYLWKLYCITLVAKTLREYSVSNENAVSLVSALEKSSLLPTSGTLSTLFRAARNYISNWLSRDASSIEYAISIDPSTGAPIASRKTEFRETSDQQLLGTIPVDELLSIANQALREEKLKFWILFDRLDVAFADSADLERNALRALFRAYNDLKVSDRIALKIFVRNDIWRRITEGGFTEASHITKAVSIQWTPNELLNLIVRRLLDNRSLIEFLQCNPTTVLADFRLQEELFYRIVPRQIDTGKNPDTLNWIVSRTTDSSGASVPREVIHLMDLAKDHQVKLLERGGNEPEEELLFDRSSFKDSLPLVSKVRFEQTLLAEYPDVASSLKLLDGEKCEHTTTSLARIWQTDEEKSLEIARKLVDIGFFELRGSKQDPRFWVPFLYRSALNLVQGSADD